MAYLAVSKEGTEVIFLSKPHRKDDFWTDESDTNPSNLPDTGICLCPGSIYRLINKELTWKDEPYRFSKVITEPFTLYQNMYKVSNNPLDVNITPYQISEVLENRYILSSCDYKEVILAKYGLSQSYLVNNNARFYSTRKEAVNYHNELINKLVVE